MFSGNLSVSPAFHPDFQRQLRRGALKICSKFTGEHPCQSAVSISLLCNFVEVTLRNGCFPVNLLHIFQTPFLNITSDGLLLDFSCPHGPPPALSSNLDYFLLLAFQAFLLFIASTDLGEYFILSCLFYFTLLPHIWSRHCRNLLDFYQGFPWSRQLSVKGSRNSYRSSKQIPTPTAFLDHKRVRKLYLNTSNIFDFFCLKLQLLKSSRINF